MQPMKKPTTFLPTIILVLILAFMLGTTVFMTGCASGPKADIPTSANPQDEVARFETDLKAAAEADADVLAFKEYNRAVKHLEQAKREISSQDDAQDILDDVRYGRAQLEIATSTAQQRRAKAPTVLDARRAAMKAGAARFPALQKELAKVDDEIRDRAEDLSKVDSKKMMHLQNRYVALERDAVVHTELSGAMGRIEDARKNHQAKRSAPHTLQTAEVDLANARTAVETNVHDQVQYKPAVDRANASARMLTDVINTIHSSGTKNLPEGNAIQMVTQQRKIQDLESDVSTQAAQLSAAKQAGRAKDRDSAARTDSFNRQLSEKDRALKGAAATISLQEALEKARSEFSADEAEAYQQGDSLLIRLKSVRFASGRADLPRNSLAVLAKVNGVAKDLGAGKIKVEGHTDSTGTETKNQVLSEKRADAVATYLKTNGLAGADVSSEGYGLSKPLASNKSRAGRAQNRRVDVVITPGADSPTTSQE